MFRGLGAIAEGIVELAFAARRAWLQLDGSFLRFRWYNAVASDAIRWNADTLAAFTDWKARDADPFICSVQAHRRGQSLQRHALRRRFLTACKALGRDRLRTLTIHHGHQHTFISPALSRRADTRGDPRRGRSQQRPGDQRVSARRGGGWGEVGSLFGVK